MAVCHETVVFLLSLWLIHVVNVFAKAVRDATHPGQELQELLRMHDLPWSTGTVRNKVADNPCLFPRWIVTDYTPCGDDYCRCRDTVADCSLNYGRLTYVPSLPAGISKVLFTFNMLARIARDDFFANISSVTDLDLYGNNLTYISPGVFRPFSNLKAVRLGHNNLTYTALAPVLSVTTLTLVDLFDNRLGPPPDGFFHKYHLPHLETICLNRNNIMSLNMTVFKPLARLHNLLLVGNGLTGASLHPDYLPQFSGALELNWNSFHNFLETCQGESSFYPNLTRLDMSFPVFSRFHIKKVCLPSLELLLLVDLFLAEIPEGSFNGHQFPSLKYLLLYNIVFRDTDIYIRKNAFRNPELRELWMVSNRINFASDHVDADCFAGSPNLVVLYLDGNNFRDVSEQKFNRLFRQVPSLVYLRLESAEIYRIRAGMFANMSNLAALGLGSNKLSDIPDGVFDKLPKLMALDLSMNKISVLRETLFSAATRQRLKYLDLSGNPFLCLCELRWFRQWLNTQPALFSNCIPFRHPCYTYTCQNLPNTTVQSFYMPDQACLWSSAVSKFIIATTGILMALFTLVLILYRYRWHFRLLMYEAHRPRGDRWRRLQEQHFRYDVFVSYDSEDNHWVREQLMPVLEERLGLRLCIHQRDFTLGAPIVQNIEESVQESKKIMMVFSRNFADSCWCQFELQLSLTHVLENDDALLVVLLEDIPTRDLTPAMIAVMKTMTYIEWDDEPEARASFWGRIQIALNEILPARD